MPGETPDQEPVGLGMRLLRPPPIGRLPRSFRLHSPRYARETIAASGSMRVALATMPIHERGSRANCILPCLVITTFFLSATAARGTPRSSDVIPAPSRVAFHDGFFAVRAGTPISIPRDPRAARIANSRRRLPARTPT